MLYGLLKVIMTVALRLFYRRVYVTGLENIADEGPAIIMPNHNSSLMDAALLGILVKRPLYFFARGDVFVNGFVDKLLARFHMLPVHPHDGGRKTLGDNTKAFSRAEKILLNGGVIIFFPEGISHTDKQLKPLRKGVFRLAFSTVSQRDFRLNIPLIPAGVTYSNPFLWQSDVMVHLGTPMQLRNYVESFQANPSATLLQLSKDGYLAMEEQVPNIKNATLDSLTTAVVEIAANEFSHFTSGWRHATRKRLNLEKKVYDRLVAVETSTPGEIDKLVSEYSRLRDEHRIKDGTLCKAFRFTSMDFFLLFLSLPFLLTGLVLNALPVLIARRIALSKVTRDDFFSWIFVTTATVLYLIWYLLLVSVGLCLDWKAGLGLMLITPLTGMITLFGISKIRDLEQYKKLRALPEATRADMMRIRNQILEVVL